MREGLHLTLRGVVQGVGMRPFVYRLATAEHLGGRVWNDDAGVQIEVFGPAPALARLVDRLRTEAPVAARLDELASEQIPDQRCQDFQITSSAAPSACSPDLSIPPDLATCEVCRCEVRDPADRRHRYPFTSCTGCGPRFTIARGLPYDRARTTMAEFVLCAACRREYEDPADRRYHSEPNACPACGPQLSLRAGGAPAWPAPSAQGEAGRGQSPPTVGGRVLARGDAALAEAARALAAGRILAVKGLGGFHLACVAGVAGAVRRLRERKHREEKPLAVMVQSLAEAEALAVLGPVERALLASPAAPIVLCRRRGASDFAQPSLLEPRPTDSAPAIAAEVAPGTSTVGLLLPYTPLHDLLLELVGRPLVMTSGNLSDEPLAFEDGEALRRLANVADLFLLHDRPIAARADDSVAKVVLGAPLLLRRARGFVPGAIRLGRSLAVPTLAVGALLKSAPALGVGDRAWMGPHVGDLENAAALDAFEEVVGSLERSLRSTPRLLAHDLHPDYVSTRWARSRAAAGGVPALGVQHHHAHAAAGMAEHAIGGPAYALAWDGAGFGDDGTSWGGELLLARYDGYERLATFRPLPLAGGDRAVREPWRLALAALDDAFDGAPPLERLRVFDDRAREQDVRVVRRMIALRVNTPLAHGAGRLLDAVSAFVLDRPWSRFEGQLAIALESAVDPDEHGYYPVDLDTDCTPWQLDPRPLVRAAAFDRVAGTSPPRIAARIHCGLARAAADLVRHAVDLHGPLPVVLTGGCFANAPLVEEIARQLSPGLAVLPHRQVPPGDGGIALGQLVVADAVARRDGA